MPKKTHDLVFLNHLCTEEDREFQNIKSLCNFLNRFAAENIRNIKAGRTAHNR
jgi:hypothetical protein